MRLRVARASGQTPPCEGAYEEADFEFNPQRSQGREPMTFHSVGAWFIDLDEVPESIEGFPVEHIETDTLGDGDLLLIHD